MSITWSDVAETDLDDLYDYIARDVPCYTIEALPAAISTTSFRVSHVDDY